MALSPRCDAHQQPSLGAELIGLLMHKRASACGRRGAPGVLVAPRWPASAGSALPRGPRGCDDLATDPVSSHRPERFGPDSLRGLHEFSHVEVVYVFDRVPEDAYERGARRPRGNPAWPKVGVFAQRNKRRPDRIGVSTCRLLAIHEIELTVHGLDAIDGTPCSTSSLHDRVRSPRCRRPACVVS
jgi:tRNA-methyltransferase O